jgi:hypothetical protein
MVADFQDNRMETISERLEALGDPLDVEEDLFLTREEWNAVRRERETLDGVDEDYLGYHEISQ